ncbi:protein phosphatase 2c domain-containing protein, partial [Cystoisospora suis]
MRRIRRSHPNESTQDLLDSRQLLKGVTHATRGLGAFHLKAPEINNLLPEEKRVKNFLPAQSSRQPSPYLSSELDYMLQPFHPDVEALII